MPGRHEETGPPEARELRRLAWLLDEAIRLPGGYRIGLDGIIGLVPGIGDAVGLAAASWILLRARRFDVPRSVMTRMLANVLFDAALGAVPVVGDLFDFGFKANRRNVLLVQEYLSNERRVQRESRVRIAATLAVACLAVAGAAYLLFRFVQWLWQLAAA